VNGKGRRRLAVAEALMVLFPHDDVAERAFAASRVDMAALAAAGNTS
jgi:hypothetical protein